MASKKRRRRERLFKRNKLCHWCGVVTKPPVKGQPLEDETATLDHLEPRWARREFTGDKRTVLSCHKCNKERGIKQSLCKFGDFRDTLGTEPRW